MQDNMEILLTIRKDLDLIMVKLGIAPGGDQDHDLDHDLDLDLFKKDLSDHNLDLDLDHDQFRVLERSIRYYLKNRWKINNKGAYLKKLIATGLKDTRAKVESNPVAQDINPGPEADFALCGVPWWRFDKWADLVRHTVKFSSIEALDRYEMPDRLKAMRRAPLMVVKCVSGKADDWAQKEFDSIKTAFLAENKHSEVIP